MSAVPRPGTKARALVDAMIQGIKAGQYPPGGRLPTREELCQTYGVSPVTVHAAMAALEDLGYVSRRDRTPPIVQGPGERPKVRRWQSDELLAELAHLHHLSIKWTEMAERDGYLHPATISELGPAALRVHVMADRIWQQRLDGDSEGTGK